MSLYTQRRVNSVQERDDQLREFNVILSRLITKFTTIVKCRRTGQCSRPTFRFRQGQIITSTKTY